ncbi:Alpha-(1,3)-fucosyltransferase 11 [Mortierella sp. AD094]|nr:Alpha-(1,3)-fucosyltransferase 11 [Mortierella sp. AD094]
MPPKRARVASTKTKAASAASAPKRKRRATTTTSRRTRTLEEDEDDSEKEIETVRDYEDAVRRRILSSTTSRYDDALEQDHLAYAANLMMPASELQPAESDLGGDQNHKVVYSLGTYCLTAIVKDFKHLASDSTASFINSPAQQQWQQRQGHRQVEHHRLDRKQHNGAYFRKHVQQMPYYLSSKLFKFLKHASPELLSTKIWTSLFFPPDTADTIDIITGSGNGGSLDKVVQGSNSLYITELDLEGLIASQVTDTVIRGYILHTLNLGPQLERINLNGMDSLSDKALAQLVGACPHLARLSLKGCTKVGDMTLANLPPDSLEELNISFVAAPTTKGIKQLIFRCRELRMLKIAGVVNVKDVLFLDLEKELAPELEVAVKRSDQSIKPSPLYRLENLKISSTKLGDRGFKVLMSLCGRTLRRLDISATDVGRIGPISQFCIWDDDDKLKIQSPPLSPASSGITRLEKLNLTRLKIASPNDLLTLFKKMPSHSLHTLLIGYLTCGQVPVRDDFLHQLSSYLQPDVISTHDDLPITPKAIIHGDPFAPALMVPQEFHLHTLSLFGNSQIGQSKRQDYGLHLILKRLSPFLKRLELGYTLCRSSILEGLLESHTSGRLAFTLPGEGRMVDNLVLEELGLDETPIDDEAATVLSRFRRLNRLSLLSRNTAIASTNASERSSAEPPEPHYELMIYNMIISQTNANDMPVLERNAYQAWVLNSVHDLEMSSERTNFSTSLLPFTHSWSYTLDSDFVETLFQPSSSCLSTTTNEALFQTDAFLDKATGPPRVDLTEKNRLRALAKEQGGKAPIVWIEDDNGVDNETERAECKESPNGRENYVRELAELIDIDIYGSCMSNTPWPVHNDTQKPFMPQEIMAQYKFVLALESINCKDYVTSSLADALAVGAVPIVDGPKDYFHFSPADNALVQVDSFIAPELLAQELNALDGNDTQYLNKLGYRKRFATVAAEENAISSTSEPRYLPGLPAQASAYNEYLQRQGEKAGGKSHSQSIDVTVVSDKPSPKGPSLPIDTWIQSWDLEGNLPSIQQQQFSASTKTPPQFEMYYLLMLISMLCVGVIVLGLITTKSARRFVMWPWHHLFYSKIPEYEQEAQSLERVMLRELGDDLLYQ